MNDIVALLMCLDLYMTPTTLRQMSQIVTAMLTMTGRVTMLGLSRWAEQGGSYRSALFILSNLAFTRPNWRRY